MTFPSITTGLIDRYTIKQCLTFRTFVIGKEYFKAATENLSVFAGGGLKTAQREGDEHEKL